MKKIKVAIFLFLLAEVNTKIRKKFWTKNTEKFHNVLIFSQAITKDNISGIRTRAIAIVNVFEMDFRW